MIESAVCASLAAVATYHIMAAIDLPASPWWCATRAAGYFLIDLWDV
jgi:hypothetical protein